MQLRDARSADAKDIARLADLAASGIPYYCWKTANPHRDPWAVGEEIVQKDTSDYSYKKCQLLVSDGKAAALLNSFRRTKMDTPEEIDELPPVVQPLARLENQTVGNWYINTLATSESFQRQGCAARLLKRADDLAREAGVSKNSLIVRSGNESALRLYEASGFQVVANEKTIPFEGNLIGENWMLMVKLL